MDSNFFGRLCGPNDDQVANMLLNENGIQLGSEFMNQFAITPKLCAKILLDMCDHSKNQETSMPQQCEDIDSLANLCREFLPSTSPLMNSIQAIDNSSYLLSKAPLYRQAHPALYSSDVKNSSVLLNVNSLSSLNDKIDSLSLNGSMVGFNGQSQVGPVLTKSRQLQTPLQAHQEIHQSQTNNMFDVNAIASDSLMSISPEIEKEAATYFQRIYNQSTNEKMSISEVLDMLSRFQGSSNRRERDIFHCMIKNLFKEYCYFPQYPDKELLLTAQLFGGIIQMDLVKFVALVDALTCVLEALRQPYGSKMYYFGIVALDRFKSKLKEYPLYCRHLTAIPHFNEFPLALQKYIQFGVASKDPPPPTQSFINDIDLNTSLQTSHSPGSPCHPNSGSSGLNMSSFMNVNMNNDLNHSFNMLMPDLISNQGVIGSGSNHIGSQENCVLTGHGLPSIQSEVTSTTAATTIPLSETSLMNDTNSMISSPVISRPSITRNGLSNHNSATNDTNANVTDNNVQLNAVTSSTANVSAPAATAGTINLQQTESQTASDLKNHSSTSDQSCHASSITAPTSYSDIVKRAKKVVTASPVVANNNITSTVSNGSKDGTKLIRKGVNNCSPTYNDNVTENCAVKQPSSGTTNGIHDSNSSTVNSNNKRDKNINGCDNNTNGLDNNGSNSNNSNNVSPVGQSEFANNNSVNSISNNNDGGQQQQQNGSGVNNNSNGGNLSKLKPTNIWSYNGLRVSNVSNSCSKSSLHSLFNKFGRVKLVERINKTIENSIWVYYDNPSSPIEAAHKLQGTVIEGISAGSSPLRIYFAPTDDQKDLKFSRPKQPPDNKGECYYWRTTNCFSREQCPLLHIPANKNIDAQIWMGKMNKESLNNNQPQQQPLITQSNNK